MASAAEAELAALFTTAQEMVPLLNTLEEMGRPQPKLPIQVEKLNSSRICQQHYCCLPPQVARHETQLAQMP